MRWRAVSSLGLLLAAGALPASRAATLEVPGQYPTIQAAIDAALVGDEVAIADGVYTGAGNKKLDFKGKAITVRSASGDPNTCVIDCQGAGRGFYFHSGETSSSVVLGLTVRNGLAVTGGGVYCTSAGPRLAHCTISDCTAGWGAGIACVTNASITLNNCTILGNTATTGVGGGIDCSANSGATLVACTIAGNSSVGGGGGVHAWSSVLTLTDCEIVANSASDDSGGGIYCDYSNAVITRCVIASNRAVLDFGGGVFASSCTPVLRSCVVTDNSAAYGGGIYCASSNAVLENCRITRNTATTGGGLYLSYSAPVLTNCTLLGNRIAVIDEGSAITSFHATPSLTNCILWDNQPTELKRFTTPNITYSDVRGSWSGVGNIGVDPRLAIGDDAHILPGSLCVDVGSDTPANGLPPQDADGMPRPLDGDGDGNAHADMGAYELHNPLEPLLALSTTVLEWSVAPGQDDVRMLEIQNAGAGTLEWEVLGWDAPWLDIVGPQSGTSTGEVDALTLAVHATALTPGVHLARLRIGANSAFNAPRTVLICVRVGAVRRVPQDHATIQAGIDAAVRDDHVVLADGIHQGAGNTNLNFRGKAITVRSASGNALACIINCGGSGSGFRFYSNETPGAVVRGITIRGAAEGGVYCTLAGPTLRDCVIMENHGTDGGGVRCGEYARPVLIDCRIVNNRATNGAGVFCNETASPTLQGCTLAFNEASLYGGALYCIYAGSDPVLVGCILTHNKAYNGAGVYAYCNARPSLTNCVITSNATDFGGAGGGLYAWAADAELRYSTLTGNSATSGGALACYQSSSQVALAGCVLWGDSPTEVALFQDAVATASNSLVQGGWAGVGNLDADPQFAFPQDVHPLPSSPVVDAAGSPSLGNFLSADGEGVLRPIDGDMDGAAVSDMGAYEFRPDTPTLALSAAAIELYVLKGRQQSFGLAIRNSGAGDMPWMLSPWTAPWLTADVAAGDSAGETDVVTLTADTADLDVGDHLEVVWIDAQTALIARRAVVVLLHVTRTRLVPEQYGTIQSAIDAAGPYDEVVLADGVYKGAGNRNLSFKGKPIVLRSASGDPRTCAIDAESVARGVLFNEHEGAHTVLRDVTIQYCHIGIECDGASPTLQSCIVRNCLGGWGTGLMCQDGSPAVANCVFRENTAASGGAGVCASGSSQPTLSNCLILGNLSYGWGGGLYCGAGAAPMLTNCDFVGNLAVFGSGGIYSAGNPTLNNCILWFDGPEEIVDSSGTAVVSHCLLRGGWAGPGNLDADPLFRDPYGPDGLPSTYDDNDYHLLPGSPCIDAGSNAAVPADTFDLNGDGNTTEPLPFDLDGLPRFVDDPNAPDCPWAPSTCGMSPIVDMGAYEFQGAGPTICPGDVNCDGAVTFSDIDPFVARLGCPSDPASCDTGCPWQNADINGDGSVTFADIDPFVGQLGTTCPRALAIRGGL